MLAIGCRPDLGAPASLVKSTRVLAVIADPPESQPGGDPVAYSLLVGSADGTLMAPSASWAFCTTPKPLDENNVVAAGCLTDQTASIADGAPSASATTPPAACSLFGPETPPSPPGKPALRPRDADVTGGYYQPVRVTVGDQIAFGLERITCDLASASLEVAQAFRMRYPPNKKPTLLDVTASIDGQPLALSQLPAGQRVLLEASWTADSAEAFPVFDPVSQTLVDHRESLRVSWFATDGAFDHERTGRADSETATTTQNGFVVPAAAGSLYLWAVLRDSRGGIDARGFVAQVQ